MADPSWPMSSEQNAQPRGAGRRPSNAVRLSAAGNCLRPSRCWSGRAPAVGQRRFPAGLAGSAPASSRGGFTRGFKQHGLHPRLDGLGNGALGFSSVCPCVGCFGDGPTHSGRFRIHAACFRAQVGPAQSREQHFADVFAWRPEHAAEVAGPGRSPALPRCGHLVARLDAAHAHLADGTSHGARVARHRALRVYLEGRHGVARMGGRRLCATAGELRALHAHEQAGSARRASRPRGQSGHQGAHQAAVPRNAAPKNDEAGGARDSRHHQSGRVCGSPRIHSGENARSYRASQGPRRTSPEDQARGTLVRGSHH